MNALQRFGISIEETLLRKFDSHISKNGYINRSEAIRDLIRNKLAEEKIENKNEVIYGIISFIYDHHKRGIEKQLNDLQHNSYKSILFTSHVHIDHTTCLEIIIAQDKASRIKNMGDRILSIKGVKNEKISLIPGAKSF
jgi:CopG family nickel-responsive transcriptional regulator